MTLRRQWVTSTVFCARTSRVEPRVGITMLTSGCSVSVGRSW